MLSTAGRYPGGDDGAPRKLTLPEQRVVAAGISSSSPFKSGSDHGPVADCTTRAAKSLIPVRMASTWSCSRAKKILLPFATGSAHGNTLRTLKAEIFIL
jgi:hypothetical protein